MPMTTTPNFAALDCGAVLFVPASLGGNTDTPTHFRCVRHGIFAWDDYGTHNAEAHDGSAPCVQALRKVELDELAALVDQARDAEKFDRLAIEHLLDEEADRERRILAAEAAGLGASHNEF